MRAEGQDTGTGSAQLAEQILNNERDVRGPEGHVAGGTWWGASSGPSAATEERPVESDEAPVKEFEIWNIDGPQDADDEPPGDTSTPGGSWGGTNGDLFSLGGKEPVYQVGSLVCGPGSLCSVIILQILVLIYFGPIATGTQMSARHYLHEVPTSCLCLKLISRASCIAIWQPIQREAAPF